MEIWDVLIIGGGTAGLSAGVYCARGKQKTILLEEKRKTGGQAATTSELENYPGIISSTGPDLMKKFREHAEKFGVEFARGRVDKIEVAEDGFHKIVTTKDGTVYNTKSVIIGTGAEPRVLGIKGEAEFKGRGVSYCATCDADFYEDLDVVVVGSGNTAVEESVFLTKFVNKITMIVIHEEGKMDADKVAQEQALSNDKINFVWNSTVDEICGDDLVTGVNVKNIKTGEVTNLACDGVFMFVGTIPKTDFVKDLIDLNPQGYIKTNEMMETSVPGIYAAGDVRDKFLRQVITAASDGSIAAVAAEKYIEEEENWTNNVLSFDGEAIILFWSPVDPQSVELSTAIEGEAIENSGKKFIKIDSYKNQLMAKKYKISTFPSVVKLDRGREVAKLIRPTFEEVKEIL
ncbi:MAG: thioredoxin-disulfide reductase [Candidatus Cloacimonadota bacterium]|nr:MAG: thioredoxin-disulfide reductase [Candidatus Cloacimonadota bacterium]PIE78429.1 MAG: thioredoxin-disulfide reductase [Candidatus Delongbacteria bacterium]